MTTTTGSAFDSTRRVRDLPRLQWGRGKDNTFCGALSAAMSVTSHPCDYDMLMGVTGLAFRVRWYEGTAGVRWCPSSASGEFAREIDLARRASGWELHAVVRPTDDDSAGTFADQQSAIASSVDDGLPVLCYDAGLDCAVVGGYDDGGRTLLISEYGRPEPVRTPLQSLRGLLIYLREYDRVMSRQEMLRMALANAVSQWLHEPYPVTERGRYWLGREAYDAWEQQLEYADPLGDSDAANLRRISGWVLTGLTDAREAAGRYLEREAECYPGRCAQQLHAAARLYARAATAARQSLTLPGAFVSTGPLETWTPAVRESEKATIDVLRDIDDEAIAQLRMAVQDMELESMDTR